MNCRKFGQLIMATAFEGGCPERDRYSPSSCNELTTVALALRERVELGHNNSSGWSSSDPAIFNLMWGFPPIITTLHPSAILRAKTDEERERDTKIFQGDLRRMTDFFGEIT